MKNVNIVILLLMIIGKCFCANILMVSLLPSKSHLIWNGAIAEALLNNKHNITFLSHDVPSTKSDNYTILHVKGNDFIEEFDAAELSKMNTFKHHLFYWDYIHVQCELDFRSDAIRALIKYPPEIFDLILFDITNAFCLYPFIDYFYKSSVIAVSAYGASPAHSDIMGHRVPAYIPIYTSTYGTGMNQIQRVHNWLLQVWDVLLKKYALRNLRKMTAEYFERDINDLEDIEKKISLFLTNVDPVLDYAQPFPPNIIPVGGLHLKPPKTLTGDLKKIVDNSRHGVIYFSLGSMITAATIKQETRNIFLGVFEKLNQTVLWKFEKDMEVPKNVIIKKWFPQQDILAHKNVKLFISHCGGLSSQEAIYHGVPILCMPIFADQPNNAAKIVSKRVGKFLSFSEFTAKELLESIESLLENSKYLEEANSLSELFRDQQNSPLERAIFWIEYILRHKEVTHLSHAGRYMTWYKSEGLDLLLLVIVFIFLVMYILFKTFKIICHYCKFRGQSLKKKSKQN